MRCYFDHMATTPLDPRVFDAMLPYLKDEFGNPQSVYDLGVRAKEAVEKARVQVAKLINSKPTEIIFTSSGAESNNLGLRGLALARQNEGRHVIVSKAEHHSILNSARVLEKIGFTVTFLPIDKYGMVDPDVVRRSITDETTIISIIHASSEVGTIQPIEEIVRIAKERNILIHTDAVASCGQIPIDVKRLGVDSLSISAHQFYGPKGAGALYVREGLRIVPLIYGGIQENGRRAGTENVPAIVGMGVAAELALSEMDKRVEHMKRLRDRMVNGLISKVSNIYYTGHPEKRLPGHASFCVEYIEGEAMLLLLASKSIYAASGSACSSKALKASPILLSMGIPANLAQGSVVFSLGKENTDEEVDYFLDEFPKIIQRLREISPYSKGWEEADSSQCKP